MKSIFVVLSQKNQIGGFLLVSAFWWEHGNKCNNNRNDKNCCWNVNINIIKMLCYNITLHPLLSPTSVHFFVFLFCFLVSFSSFSFCLNQKYTMTISQYVIYNKKCGHDRQTSRGSALDEHFYYDIDSPLGMFGSPYFREELAFILCRQYVKWFDLKTDLWQVNIYIMLFLTDNCLQIDYQCFF